MIDYNEICYFDTETTGLPPKGAKWDETPDLFPRICQLSWIFNGKEENHIIRPDGWEIPQEATNVHGITTEYALEHGEPLGMVMAKFIFDCSRAKLICGHNLYFDVSTIKAEIMRADAYGEYIEKALHKGKRIDTMRPSMKWVDARFADGRLKFPKLEELYARCFPGESFPAHDAIEDVRAVVRCLPVLVQNGLIELAVKEYPEEHAPNIQGQIIENCKMFAQAAKIAADIAEMHKNGPYSHGNSEDGKTPIETEKRPENENSAKITPEVNNRFAEMMADDDF